MISTEAVLTGPLGFDLHEATNAQRVVCRLIDGAPLDDLADDPSAPMLVGGEDALAACRGMGQPSMVVVLAAIRTAKTMNAVSAAIRSALTVDLSALKVGEVPRVSIVSLKTDTAQSAFNMLVGVLRASPVLSKFLVEEKRDSVVLRHPSGRSVEVAVVAGSRAGGGLVARWSAGVIFDEAPRMHGASDAVVNLDDALDAVAGRLLPGAQVLAIGSPHAPWGPVYDLTQDHWGAPSPDVLVIRGNGPLLNPNYWTPERCDELRRRRPAAYVTDVQGDFAEPETGLISPVAIEHSVRTAPLELAPQPGALYAAAIDPSGGGQTANAATLVVVRVDPDLEDGGHRFRVALAEEWRDAPEVFMSGVAERLRRYGLRSAATDAYASGVVSALARHHVVELVPRPGKLSQDGRDLAAAIHAGRVELAPVSQLKADLIAARRKLTQTGERVELPRTSDGRHCDFFPALAGAVAHAAEWSDFLDDDDEGMGCMAFSSTGTVDLSGGDDDEADDVEQPPRSYRLVRGADGLLTFVEGPE